MLNAEKYNLYDYSKDVNFIIQFADYLSIDKSPSTVKTYKNNIIYFFKFIIKQDNDYSIFSEKDYIYICSTEVLYQNINKELLEKYISYQTEIKLSSDIINCRINVVKSYLKFLHKKKIIEAKILIDTFDDIKRPKPIIKEQLVVKANQTLDIIKKIERTSKDSFTNKRNIAMLLLMSNTGIRRKETAGIDIRNINLENKTITIYKTKGSKPRIVVFSDMIKDVLIDYIAERDEILRKNKIKEQNNLFIKNNGHDLAIETITMIMRVISKRNKIKITCHSFRRGFATDMAECGTETYLISKMMGHSNINTTTSRYIYVLMNMIKNAMSNHPFNKVNTEKINIDNEIKNTKNDFQENITNTLNTIVLKMNELNNRIDKLSIKN
ncbi:integrase [Brachyspira hyodysenteriae]|uniref:tyrosine-type recombinase/integrase n=1 Tax=Brachyspira hyodysenteriae TaxID=159 RepID=UPI00063DD7B3|nr:site-specific integrase [Brachyspira hyodysenteriae]KLI27607.1 integrase [Brachyspira hyodysenteriae]TVL76962.1 integrase [Brachyspira hyodysenteriae]TVL87496.1 integrase [Brachyspira hyodysenteriae]